MRECAIVACAQLGVTHQKNYLHQMLYRYFTVVSARQHGHATFRLRPYAYVRCIMSTAVEHPTVYIPDEVTDSLLLRKHGLRWGGGR